MILRPPRHGGGEVRCNGARAGLGCRHPRYSPIDGRGLCMGLMRRLRIWAGSVALRRNIAIALAMAALASGIATYLALTESPPFGDRNSTRLNSSHQIISYAVFSLKKTKNQPILTTPHPTTQPCSS